MDFPLQITITTPPLLYPCIGDECIRSSSSFPGTSSVAIISHDPTSRIHECCQKNRTLVEERHLLLLIPSRDERKHRIQL